MMCKLAEQNATVPETIRRGPYAVGDDSMTSMPCVLHDQFDQAAGLLTSVAHPTDIRAHSHGFTCGGTAEGRGFVHDPFISTNDPGVRMPDVGHLSISGNRILPTTSLSGRPSRPRLVLPLWKINMVHTHVARSACVSHCRIDGGSKELGHPTSTSRKASLGPSLGLVISPRPGRSSLPQSRCVSNHKVHEPCVCILGTSGMHKRLPLKIDEVVDTINTTELTA